MDSERGSERPVRSEKGPRFACVKPGKGELQRALRSYAALLCKSILAASDTHLSSPVVVP